MRASVRAACRTPSPPCRDPLRLQRVPPFSTREVRRPPARGGLVGDERPSRILGLPCRQPVEEPREDRRIEQRRRPLPHEDPVLTLAAQMQERRSDHRAKAGREVRPARHRGSPGSSACRDAPARGRTCPCPAASAPTAPRTASPPPPARAQRRRADDARRRRADQRPTRHRIRERDWAEMAVIELLSRSRLPMMYDATPPAMLVAIGTASGPSTRPNPARILLRQARSRPAPASRQCRVS